MLLTDTDTLMYKIKADNIHEDFYKNKELFGFSNYPKDSKYYNNKTYTASMKGFSGI